MRRDSHPSQATKICSPVGSICLLKEKAVSFHVGQRRKDAKRARGELQIINNFLSCCSNSGIQLGRRVRAGGLQPSTWFSAAAWLSCPQGTWGHRGHGLHKVRGGTGFGGRTGRVAAGSTALLVVVGLAQELGRGMQPVPPLGPRGRKSLPACGGDSLAERAPPALLQIS